MPTLPVPMSAATARTLPADGDWVFEPKYDGVRVVAEATPQGARLVTRNGKDKSRQFPEVVEALQALARRRGRRLVLDGELVALVNGEPARFQAIQARTHVQEASEIARRRAAAPAALVLFDLLEDGDTSLLDEPWRARRARLGRVIGAEASETLRVTETMDGDGAGLLDRARRAGWEGVIAKRADARYRPGTRSDAWRKLKLEHRQEFVVGGWTEPRRTRPHLGALMLGYHDADGGLVYAGHAGGGLTHDDLRELRAQLQRLARKTSPFTTEPRANEAVHWVTPRVVVEVRFNEWTDDGLLRQPIVLGVREDKDARDVVREPESVQQPGASGAGRRERVRRKPSRGASARARRSRATGGAATAAVVARLRQIEDHGGDGTLELPQDGGALELSNLGKTFFPEPGCTKGDLLRYYATVAPLLLPIVAERPLVLKRYPNGVDGKFFFQQNAPDELPDGVRVEVIDTADGEPARRFVAGNLTTLLYTAQLGAISVDPWNARVRSLEQVDYAILDLDPGESASFATVIAVAREVRAALRAMGRDGRLKTSGKRGLHIYLELPKGASEDEALALAGEVAARVALTRPDVATVERSVKARAKGTVYVDYLQNIIAKPVAAAYCVRATPLATVSTPLAWDELTDDLDPTAFTIQTVPERIGRVGDRWLG